VGSAVDTYDRESIASLHDLLGGTVPQKELAWGLACAALGGPSWLRHLQRVSQHERKRAEEIVRERETDCRGDVWLRASYPSTLSSSALDTSEGG
jgi:hypothetical protein